MSKLLKLNISEIRILIASIVLKELGQQITSENISNITNMEIQHIRNTLRSLTIKGLLKVISHPTVFSLMASGGREKIYDLAMSIEELFDRYPEMLDAVRVIQEEELRASSKEEFLKKVENLKNTNLGKMMIERLGEKRLEK
jgi:predicted transcriptional regulator